MELPFATFNVLLDLRGKGIVLDDHAVIVKQGQNKQLAILTVWMPQHHFHTGTIEKVHHALTNSSTGAFQVLVMTKLYTPAAEA